MTYDGLLLAGVAAELRAALVGGRISKIKQPSSTDLLLVVHNRGADYRTLFSVDAQFPRVYLTSVNPQSPWNPFGFCMTLRKYIEGSFITAIEQLGFDRILVLRLEAPDGNRARLIHEIMGKHGNLILVNDEGRILTAAKVVTKAMSRERQIIPGRSYTPPPGGKIDPITVTREQFADAFSDAQDDPRGWLMRTFAGIGPFLAGELVTRASGGDLWDALEWLRGVVTEGHYSPISVMDERRRTAMVYPTPVLRHPTDRQFARSSLSEALDTYYLSAISGAAVESERTRLMGAARRAIQAREKSLDLLRQTVGESAKAEEYKVLGDLIIAHMGQIEKGVAVATVVNYYDPDLSNINIPLEPELTPKENAERYFRRARKARDGASAAADRIEETEKEIGLLRPALPEIERLNTVEALKELREKLVSNNLLREEQTVQARSVSEQPFEGMRIKRVTSSDGWEILIGENSLANDYLTTKVATPNDLWFHARAVKGAHVVIRTNNRPQSVSPGAIRHAAELAAAGSDAKHSSLVPVDYTLKKHVRKPRGSSPGFVRYQNEKTLDVTPGR